MRYNNVESEKSGRHQDLYRGGASRGGQSVSATGSHHHGCQRGLGGSSIAHASCWREPAYSAACLAAGLRGRRERDALLRAAVGSSDGASACTGASVAAACAGAALRSPLRLRAEAGAREGARAGAACGAAGATGAAGGSVSTGAASAAGCVWRLPSADGDAPSLPRAVLRAGFLAALWRPLLRWRPRCRAPWLSLSACSPGACASSPEVTLADSRASASAWRLAPSTTGVTRIPSASWSGAAGLGASCTFTAAVVATLVACSIRGVAVPVPRDT